MRTAFICWTAQYSFVSLVLEPFYNSVGETDVRLNGCKVAPFITIYSVLKIKQSVFNNSGCCHETRGFIIVGSLWRMCI